MRKGQGPLGKKATVLAALVASRWIISEAARELGVSREAVYRAMARHKIKRSLSKRALSEVLSAAGARGGRPRTRSAA